MEAAEEVNARVVLGDLPVSETLKKLEPALRQDWKACFFCSKSIAQVTFSIPHIPRDRNPHSSDIPCH